MLLAVVWQIGAAQRYRIGDNTLLERWTLAYETRQMTALFDGIIINVSYYSTFKVSTALTAGLYNCFLNPKNLKSPV